MPRKGSKFLSIESRRFAAVLTSALCLSFASSSFAQDKPNPDIETLKPSVNISV